MARHDLCAVTQWITAAAQEHGQGLPEHVMARLGISRRSALALLNKLVTAQWLAREGKSRHFSFVPGSLRQVVQRYALAALQEDLPWQRDFAPHFSLPPAVACMAQHVFSELLNNVIDHSGGTHVVVSMRTTALHLQLLVSDDGCGVFERVQQSFGIGDPTIAMRELSKGKLTSAPDRHAGHGLFFTSRLADVFHLHANHRAFQYRGWDCDSWHPTKAVARDGTSVYIAINLDTPRTLDQVLKAHNRSGEGYGLESTCVPLQLMTGPQTGVESRAQTKRM
jgi:anti-sigma regulatory factor (Ser/Thr protein kinase)